MNSFGLNGVHEDYAVKVESTRIVNVGKKRQNKVDTRKSVLTSKTRSNKLRDNNRPQFSPMP